MEELFLRHPVSADELDEELIRELTVSNAG
jgi:hypothetical protein